MKLTPNEKARIDSMSYEDLLNQWRFAQPGDPWFYGETGEYWEKREKELRNQPGRQRKHVATSKAISGER
jgi:hypothetical protein